MIRVELTTDEIDALDEAIDDPELNERYGKRLLALKMHALGVPNSKIAHCLRVSDDTITNYIKLYRDKGLGGLIENRYYKPVSSVEPYLEEITAEF